MVSTGAYARERSSRKTESKDTRLLLSASLSQLLFTLGSSRPGPTATLLTLVARRLPLVARPSSWWLGASPWWL
eukprot:3787336-Pleurochrysis_carterae.AAC.1